MTFSKCDEEPCLEVVNRPRARRFAIFEFPVNIVNYAAIVCAKGLLEPSFHGVQGIISETTIANGVTGLHSSGPSKRVDVCYANAFLGDAAHYFIDSIERNWRSVTKSAEVT